MPSGSKYHTSPPRRYRFYSATPGKLFRFTDDTLMCSIPNHGSTTHGRLVRADEAGRPIKRVRISKKLRLFMRRLVKANSSAPARADLAGNLS